ncbi:hypothetical protein [Pandoraea communis]|uniref:hypothetical protein n=1 Tax=Pandoraea communis TaxID=2508297 RepID=UPI0025A55AD2|nr:hypothetical protein [Pandoraea communis]MDM8356645.1 hypothetical protein [Pandoraea communis]
MSNAAKRAAAERAWKTLRPLMNDRHARPTLPARPGSPRYYDEIEAKQALRDALERHSPILLAALAFYIKFDAQRRDDADRERGKK